MRDPRMFFSGCLYEIVFRARRGIPMPARPLLNRLILSALARTQRDFKVTICNFVWMGNHAHLLVISGDTQELVNFYGELKKRLTESIKRLLGLSYSEHLSLWENRTSVPQILDLDEAIERTVYAFCNPSAAGLVTSIDDYPGLSTWREFCSLPADVSSKSELSVPWARMPDIPRLSSPNFSRVEESNAIARLDVASSQSESNILTIHPFAWLKVFGINDSEDATKYRDLIIETVRNRESHYCEERKLCGRVPIGKRHLGSEGISLTHTPKRHGSKLCVLSSIKELRINFIFQLRAFKVAVRECYKLMKQGYTDIQWPPAAFIPPKPRLLNPLWIG